MSNHHQIDYVELPAANLEASEAFYSATFGWTFTSYGPEYQAFSDGKFNGGFRRSDSKSRADDGAALIVLFSRDLEATRDTIAANGGTICKDIFAFPGGRRFHFLDPNGNELAIWSDK